MLDREEWREETSSDRSEMKSGWLEEEERRAAEDAFWGRNFIVVLN